ncbi:LTA synthase family protein [Candidatus Nomurabacteria bacterium]|nr:LTA synthase family protein [Candidatus Nomurabacteria bacterium]
MTSNFNFLKKVFAANIFIVCFFGYLSLYFLLYQGNYFFFFDLLKIIAILFLFLVGAIFVPQRHIKYLAALLAGFFVLDFALLLFHLLRHASFNWFYFWYNRQEAWQTIDLVFQGAWWYLLAALFFIFTFFYFIKHLFVFFKNKFKLKSEKYFFLFLVILLLSLSFISTNNLELVKVIKEAFSSNSEIVNLYQDYYQKIIKDYTVKNQRILDNSILNSEANIFFLHLESLNGEFLSSEITPNFQGLENKGLVFKNMQTNNVQTIRGEENILCPVLASIDQDLHRSGLSSQALCLPKVLKSLGYKTIFFKSHDLSFADTGEFMKNIGFDEVHSSDIMSPEDQELAWGYREDLFYQRVLEYLKQYQDQKIFAYIAVSTTNHVPFVLGQNYQDLNLQLPSTGDSFLARLKNTTFVQDYFFGNFLERWQEKYQSNSHLFAFGDQAWPVGKHDNYYNEAYAYQENFLSSLAVLSPELKTFGLKENYLSQNDIFLSILSLLGLDSFQSPGKNIFTTDNKCIIAVQPYSRRYITAINYPEKYIYNILDNILEIYNLADDPAEKNPLFVGTADDLSYLENCLENIAN